MSAISAASISQQRLSLIAEVTRGTTPTTPGYTVIPSRVDSFLQLEKQFPQSTLIRSDRSPSPSIGGTYQVGGTIKTPVIRESGFDLLLQSALASTFATLTTAAITGTFASGGKTFTRAAGNFLTDTPATRPQIGMWFFGAGTSSNKTTLNNGGTVGASDTTFTLTASTAFTTTGGYLKIDSEIIKYSGIAANVVTVTQRGACGTTAATHTDTTTVIPGRQITAVTATVLTFGNDTVVSESSISTTFSSNASVCTTGTTRSFFTVEEKYSDITAYRTFKGVEVNTMQLQVPTSGEVDADFNVVGLSYTGAQEASATYTATAGRKPASGSTTSSALYVDGAAFVSCLENLTFNLGNQRAPKFGVGSPSACLVEEGPRTHELSFQAYLTGLTEIVKFNAETRFALGITVSSPDLDLYGFNWGSLLYTGAPFQVSGQTVSQNLTARAEYNTTDACDFFVWKAQVTA